MKLLSENELVWSWVVANSKMNRKRNASGVNSYEKELKIKPEVFLEEYIRQFGSVKWLDICCGDSRTRLLTCKGPRQINFNVTYKGANDEAGPNYTGQDSVCSVYVQENDHDHYPS